MARASIVIGLGGTGQWVLTYLKNDLIEANKGVVPDNVQLLGIDTQLPDVAIQGAAAADNGNQEAQVGAVRLDNIGEFMRIGEPLYDYVKQIHGQNPRAQEYAWVDTDFLMAAGPAVCSTVNGAGAYRQLARLSLFNKLDEIYNKLQTLITRGNAAAAGKAMVFGGTPNKPDRLEIIVVSSLAGGTGAGIFLDVAWLIRKAARMVNCTNYKLTGFFVMPTAWEQAGQDQDKRLRAYAAWSELDRFMLSTVDGNVAPTIYYRTGANPLYVKCDQRIFDNAYVIDQGIPALNALKAEDATYPVVAQAVSALLDDNMGQIIALDNSNNDTLISALPRASYYNGVGTFTFKTPEHFSKNQVLNEYRLATLEQLLSPVFGAGGDAIAVRSDCNLEATPSTIEYGARVFLESAEHGNRPNVALLPEIQTVSTRGEDRTKYVDDESRAIVSRRGATYKALMTRVNVPDLQKKLDELTNEHIYNYVRLSADRNPIVLPRTIRHEILTTVENKDTEWFGQWGYVRDPRNPQVEVLTRVTEGTKVVLCREAGKAIVKNYRTLLETWSSIQLNGRDLNAVKGKSGKLGYLLGVYGELDKKFEAYLSFLGRLKDRISEQQIRVKLTGARDAARQNYDANAGRENWLAPGRVHPDALDSERGFIAATDNLFTFYLSEAIIQALEEAVREMQDFTRKSCEALRAWVKVLIEGKQEGKPEERFVSLFNYAWGNVRGGASGLQAEIDRGNRNFATSHELKGVQQMLDIAQANRHYQANNRIETFRAREARVTPYNAEVPEIQAGLAAFNWKVNCPEGANALGFSLELEDENEQRFNLQNAETNDAVRENDKIINRVLNEAYNQHVAPDGAIGTQVVQLLADQFNVFPALAQNLRTLSTPLYSTLPGAGVVYKNNHMFMQLDAAQNTQYFTGLENAIRIQLNGANEGINLFNNGGNCVTSSDPFKFTFLQIHNIIEGNSFNIIRQMKTAFTDTIAVRDLPVSPARQFVYNAERSAHELAILRSQQERENYIPFVPEIVGLLEEPEKAKLFFLAWAHGLITFMDGYGMGSTDWSLKGPEGREDVLFFSQDETGLSDDKKPTVYEALSYWIVGRDARPQRNAVNRIVWNDLNQRIRALEGGAGWQTAVESYESQMDENNQKSLAGLIQFHADRRRTHYEQTGLLYYQAEMFEHLLALAKLIYKERIKLIDGAMGGRAGRP